MGASFIWSAVGSGNLTIFDWVILASLRDWSVGESQLYMAPIRDPKQESNFMNTESNDTEGNKATKPYPIGQRVVKAWLRTVINPLLVGLDRELPFLNGGNATWRFQREEFEVVGNYYLNVEPVYLPNFEHFMDLNPDFVVLHTIYMEEREDLRKACLQLQHDLEASNGLRELYRRLTDANSLKKLDTSLSDLFGAYPEERHLSYLAELIVNSTPELPSYYVIHPLWNAHRDEFLLLRSSSEVRDPAIAQRKELDGLRDQNIKITTELKRVRNILVQSYDIPPVPIQ